MALGASAADMLAMVVRETLVVGIAGTALGLAGALGLTRVMAGMLHGVEPTDAGAIAIASAVLLAAALVAAYVPARRTARVQPMVALRVE
jgi:putative ABC transport system permease protein